MFLVYLLCFMAVFSFLRSLASLIMQSICFFHLLVFSFVRIFKFSFFGNFWCHLCFLAICSILPTNILSPFSITDFVSLQALLIYFVVASKNVCAIASFIFCSFVSLSSFDKSSICVLIYFLFFQFYFNVGKKQIMIGIFISTRVGFCALNSIPKYFADNDVINLVPYQVVFIVSRCNPCLKSL